MNEFTFTVLRLLADGKFHSGETIAQALKVSRATVWNAVQDAKNLGIDIFSVRGRGYKLPHAVTLLDKKTIMQAMSDAGASNKSTMLALEIHDHLESSNTYLMKKLSAGQHTDRCVAVNLQTHGRGRRGRTWQAGLGVGLTFSILKSFQCGASALSGLSLSVGLALIRALQQLGITKAKLKWPNDILIEGKKLAGILIELQGDMEGPSYAIIGVGLNLNLPKNIQQKIDQPTTDLASASTTPINPNILLGFILKNLTDVLNTFEQQGFAALHEEWTKHHAYHQQQVNILHPNGNTTTGTVLNVCEEGNLCVSTHAGEQRFSSGEISLRGS